jgi:hypothetical protein
MALWIRVYRERSLDTMLGVLRLRTPGCTGNRIHRLLGATQSLNGALIAGIWKACLSRCVNELPDASVAKI